jgi:hypothetical protein
VEERRERIRLRSEAKSVLRSKTLGQDLMTMMMGGNENVHK